VYLSTQAGWYDVNGNAVYVKANGKFADDHPAVKALPSIFEKISDDGPPVKGKVQAAVAAAKSAAAGTGKASGG
jgi:hypothetical protein